MKKKKRSVVCRQGEGEFSPGVPAERLIKGRELTTVVSGFGLRDFAINFFGERAESQK